jgi:hypothetical protein
MRWIALDGLVDESVSTGSSVDHRASFKWNPKDAQAHYLQLSVDLIDAREKVERSSTVAPVIFSK